MLDIAYSKHTCLLIIATLIINHVRNTRVREFRCRCNYAAVDRLSLWLGRGSIEVLASVCAGAGIWVRPWRYRDIVELAHGGSNKVNAVFWNPDVR